MNLYLPDLARQSVPRYTSYPTAAEFHDGVGVSDQATALEGMGKDAAVSLYLHIPYCRQICWYCGCNTNALGRGERLKSYRASLEREIDAVARRLESKVVAIHFGGGSPNAMSAGEFVDLLDLLRRRFRISNDVEIAVELDPRGLDRDYATILADAGVNRASLGVQTFAAHVQAAINRIQPLEMIEKVVAALRLAGIARINFDLMYGLPHQSEGDVVETLSEAIRMEPDRIAMFGYAHIPTLLARQRMIEGSALPDGRARFAQNGLAHALLVGAGYHAIGFDHFALPEDPLSKAARAGRLRRNFQGFTNEPGDAVIGLGATAISEYPGLLVQNEKHVGRYRIRADNVGLAGMRGVVRKREDRLRGAIIERLLCTGTVDVAAIAADHGRPPADFAQAFQHLRSLESRGVLSVDGWTCAIRDEGWPYARIAASAFDAYRQTSASAFSAPV